MGGHRRLVVSRAPPSRIMEDLRVGNRWFMVGYLPGTPRKGVHSLILLVVWKIWKESNSSTFQRMERNVPSLLSVIKEDARIWADTGAKQLQAILPTI